MLKFQPVLPYRCIVLAMHGFQPLLELKTFKVPLTKLYLLPDFQRRGIGTFLIRQLIAQAKALNAPLRLRVLAVNPARRLYEREGFSVQAQIEERIFMEYKVKS
ncbi:hypothetical protein DSM107010_72900 [Chroococcidiopsis cubana SAG 39.79]|uniref:N-acetyltransferase domain-containing protein n=1 Tax=Chroococcidiopsis cubana SAG 39.79 TaxID=388085 RepID=A0AB37U7C3_9CYAN|nr:GNAT family N-acetyltransferase [Chroococcidiopsis cubana]RUS92785.1 hypothetical protein DSM107010_72900 [Chroococcidiopsis cubana SAG 39.79]